ncbi:MAG: hypothetical protein M5R36_21815 [Deltaproteobacteria bacterium]|nr:hypothetical protein [Deltaproteobacteria bacterium]
MPRGREVAAPAEEISAEEHKLPEHLEELTAESEALVGEAVATEILDRELPTDFDISDLEREEFELEELFAEDLLVDPEIDLDGEQRESLQNRVNKMNVLNKMRLALKGNIEARNILIKSANRLIQECVLRNPRITVEEVIRLTKDKSQREELVRIISRNRDWTKNYAVIHHLCLNPKTPLEMALKYLHRLTAKDLANIARSKQVPGMLAVQARKLYAEKERYR